MEENLKKIRLGSLFSGRGGFEIGAAAAGIETAWTCEIDYFLYHKLKKIVPNAKHYRDARLMQNPPQVEIISAGFPCQDISISNARGKAGIKGDRSGLWSEVYRIAAAVKPRYLVIENSPELLRQGFEYVLRDLSQIGYSVEWDCWRASDFGYPHRRLRLYAVAYAGKSRRRDGLLQPPGAFALSRRWSPTEAYLRVSAERVAQFRNTTAIRRDNEFLDFRREIAAFGNAVMPVVTEHLFRCILAHRAKVNDSKIQKKK
jgi:DNA (cytosine-5)-methyltransferase 1